ncbi:hypothetical protein Ciccas_007282, partial [Cichlidogyrus casuarinus]
VTNFSKYQCKNCSLTYTIWQLASEAPHHTLRTIFGSDVLVTCSDLSHSESCFNSVNEIDIKEFVHEHFPMRGLLLEEDRNKIIFEVNISDKDQLLDVLLLHHSPVGYEYNILKLRNGTAHAQGALKCQLDRCPSIIELTKGCHLGTRITYSFHENELHRRMPQDQVIDDLLEKGMSSNEVFMEIFNSLDPENLEDLEDRDLVPNFQHIKYRNRLHRSINSYGQEQALAIAIKFGAVIQKENVPFVKKSQANHSDEDKVEQIIILVRKFATIY